MIRFIRAFVWLRWRVTVNSLRGGRRRDTTEQLSRIAATIVPWLYGLTIAPGAILIGFLAYRGGRILATAGPDPFVITLVRAALAFATALLILAPLVRSIQGSSMDNQRMQLLPVSSRLLYLAEVAGCFTDPWLAVFVPGTLMLGVGLAAGGAWVAGGVALLASVVVLMTLAGLGTLISLTAAWIFRDRRRAEPIMLGLLMLLALGGVVPGLIDKLLFRSADTAQQANQLFERFAFIVKPFPSELFGATLEQLAAGRAAAALAHLAALAGMGSLLFLAGARLHRGMLETPESAGSRRTAGKPNIVRFWLPLVSSATATIAWTQFRMALRTVRGKMAVFTNAPVVAFIYLMLLGELDAALASGPALPIGPFLLFVGWGLTLLSLQPILLNQFATDGPGFSLTTLAPVSERQIVRGKLLGCAMLAGLSLVLCLAAALLSNHQGHPLYWTAMLLVIVASFALVAPISSVLSALLPRTANLARIGRGGNPHPLAGFVGVVAVLVALAIPAGLFLLGLFLAESPGLTLGLAALWLALALAVGAGLERVATALVGGRRENLLLVASGR